MIHVGMTLTAVGVSPCITPVARWLGSTKSSGSANTPTPLRRRVAPRTRSKSAVSRRPGSGFSRQPPTPVPGRAGRDRARPCPGPSRRSACPGEPEVFRSLRLELVRPPDPLHRGVREAGRLGHRVLAPVRAVRRPGVQRHSRRPAGPIGLHRRLAGWPAGLLEQAGNAARPIALPPQPHRRLAGLQRRAMRDRAEPVGTQEHDLRPSYELLRRDVVLHEFQQPVAVVRRQVKAFKAIDAEQESYPFHLGKACS